MDAQHLYYIHHCFRRQANAGAKPSTDVEAVLAAIGAKAIGLPQAFFKSDKMVHLRDIANNWIVKAKIPRNQAVLLQYPAQYAINDLAHLAKKRGNKLIVFIHDLNVLRGRPEADYPEVLRMADVIIVHTPAMEKWVHEHYPQAKTVVLSMFDYIQTQLPEAAPSEPRSIVFAGNLGKSTFLNRLNFPENIRLVLFGIGAPKSLIEKPFVDYRGSCMPEEIPANICGESFGLVWDGDSVDNCSGPMGTYLRYNAPYKLSSYIAAGIPVIIWSQMGIADFVKSQGIGITVDNLSALPDLLRTITPEQYASMRSAAVALQAKVSAGGFAHSAIDKALESC